MNRSTLFVVGGIVITAILCIFGLLITGHDGSSLIGFIGTVIVALPSILAYDKSQNAAASAAQTVTQTNGRITELIAANKSLADAVTSNPGIPLAASISDDGASVGITSTTPTEG